MNRHLPFLLFFVFVFVFVPSSASTICLADPTIWYEDGVFYLTGTGDVNNGFVLYSSTDMVHWKKNVGKAGNGRVLSKSNSWGNSGFWAPQFFKKDGLYYMAYTAEEKISIATSDSPLGPFRQETKEPIATRSQIDPFLFQDDDGSVWLYHVRFDGGNVIYAVQMNDDMKTVKENTAKQCIRARSGTWENTAGASIAEGPTVIKDDGYYYLIYSCNDYQNINYAVGYAYSTNPTGPWKRCSEPFLSRHHIGQNGTGHGDLFRDGEGQWWYVFHMHASNTTVHNRRTAIVPIRITDDRDNKFVVDAGRWFLLDDAATPSASVPDAPRLIEYEDITYSQSKTGPLNVTFAEGTYFGAYKGKVVIPDSIEVDGTLQVVKTVDHDAFYACHQLTAVTLPASVTNIGSSAFEECTLLRSVTVNRRTPPRLGTNVFDDATLSRATLYVPEGCTNLYSKAQTWSSFAHVEELPPTAVSPLDEESVEAEYIYDLQGRRLSVPPSSGIYFMGGKKYLNHE